MVGRSPIYKTVTAADGTVKVSLFLQILCVCVISYDAVVVMECHSVFWCACSC